MSTTTIGIRSWAQVIPGFDPAELAQRPLPTQVGTEIGARPVRARPVSGFDDGTDGWTPSDNADGVESVGGALRVHFDADLPAWSTDEKTWKAAQLVLADPLDASATRTWTSAYASRLLLRIRHTPAPPCTDRTAAPPSASRASNPMVRGPG